MVEANLNTVSVHIPAFTVSTKNGKRGQTRRQCTGNWKIKPIRRFIRGELGRRGLKATPGVVASWMGITTDEWTRMHDSDVKYITNEYPLVDLRMSRSDCKDWLVSHDLPIPPKSSCTFCPFKSVRSWKDLKRAGGPGLCSKSALCS